MRPTKHSLRCGSMCFALARRDTVPGVLPLPKCTPSWGRRSRSRPTTQQRPGIATLFQPSPRLFRSTILPSHQQHNAQSPQRSRVTPHESPPPSPKDWIMSQPSIITRSLPGTGLYRVIISPLTTSTIAHHSPDRGRLLVNPNYLNPRVCLLDIGGIRNSDTVRSDEVGSDMRMGKARDTPDRVPVASNVLPFEMESRDRCVQC